MRIRLAVLVVVTAIPVVVAGPVAAKPAGSPGYTAAALKAMGARYQAMAAYYLGNGPKPAARASRKTSVHVEKPPSADEFARVFVEATQRFAVKSDDASRISGVDCVQATPGRYMCSYMVTRPGESSTCHLMQARWTPRRESTITVTLAGRTRACGSLREALDSLPES